jgi:hypothetical protein
VAFAGGINALSDNICGSNNIAIGYEALCSNINGCANMCYGMIRAKRIC